MPFEPGQVIVYREKGKFFLGVILEDKGEKLLIISEEKNKNGNLARAKIQTSLKHKIPTSIKPYEILHKIKKLRNEIELITMNIKLDELYSLLSEEEENTGYNCEELSDLYFFSNGGKVENILAMGFALSNDTLYFKLKNEKYYTKDKKQIEKTLIEKEIQKANKIKRKEERDTVITWLKDFIAKSYDKNMLPPPREVIKFFEPARQYIIFKENYNKKDLVLDILKELEEKVNFKINNKIEGFFSLFVKLGIFKEDENLSLFKYNIPNTFKAHLQDEINKVRGFREHDFNARQDLRKLFTFTIDNIETSDIDDALSLEIVEEGYRLGIHITDVDYFISPNTLLDKEGLDRRSSIYLPYTKIPMFPNELSEDKLSLNEGKICPALSFLILFSKDFQVIDKEIILSVIKIDRNMTYTEVEESLRDKSHVYYKTFETMYRIAKSLCKSRTENGAIEFNNPDIKIKIDENGEIKLDKINRNLKANLIVREAMILANYICAIFCSTNNIPAIYFYQEQPNEAIVLNDKVRENKYLLLEEMKKMQKAEISLYPDKHFALGLSAYIQCTSPIRRYHDLIIHRQIKTYLDKGTPYYSMELLRMIYTEIKETISHIRNVEKESIRYWTLKYLEQQESNSQFKATVLKRLAGSYFVEIDEVLTHALLSTPFYVKLGEKVDVFIAKVNPLLDNLFVRPTFS